jgi:hypothetical protein
LGICTRILRFTGTHRARFLRVSDMEGVEFTLDAYLYHDRKPRPPMSHWRADKLHSSLVLHVDFPSRPLHKWLDYRRSSIFEIEHLRCALHEPFFHCSDITLDMAQLWNCVRFLRLCNSDLLCASTLPLTNRRLTNPPQLLRSPSRMQYVSPLSYIQRISHRP